MRGTEQLGRLFEFQLDLLSEDSAINIDDVLGQAMTVSLDIGGGEKRYFHGQTVGFSQLEDYGKHSAYHAIVRPWFWYLTRRADCRIFQEMIVPDIIKQVFKDLGFTDFKDSMTGSYREWEYLVQYRETDFNFVSRLMELEGIYYYFEHEEGKHTLVLADGYSSHSPCPGYGELPYFPPQPNASRERDHIYQWSISRQIQPGKYALDDYDFEKASADLATKLNGPTRSHSESDYEIFDYPGQYAETSDGDNYIKYRVEELHAQWERVHGRGTARGLYPGGLFNLTNYPRDDQNREYLITSASYELSSNAYEPEPVASPEDTCHCSISAIVSSTPYRAPRLTPKPMVQGPQTAVVVGKSGEEIWTDKYGRVKVQFHWDRYGKSDENSSCWMRVAQIWAGKQWGGMHIPRIGQEVIVEFLEGDPDRPIITGRVYNSDNMPPYELPANQTQSGILSRSSKTGTANNFNELRFEDKKDEEEVYFHAEKDFNRVVENNDTLKVGFEKADKGDQTIEIHNNQTLTVGNSESDEGNQTLTIWKDRTSTIETGNETHQIKKGNRTVTIDKGDDTLEIKAGDQTVTITAGKNVTTAGTSIELKVGQSSIKIEPAKITIKSVDIVIEGIASVKASAPMTTVEGSATLTLKGGLVLIN
jgi:type VI secretion system secreted protein VgrG